MIRSRLRRYLELRAWRHEVLILACLADWKSWSGYDISRRTGVRSGVLYPTLTRLERSEQIEAHWDPSSGRRLYRLEEAGE